MLKKIMWAVFALFLLAQFIRPSFTNPPVSAAEDIRSVLQTPAEVQQILKNACYDCHSNETVYPWYAQISPVSWWLADHVIEGREKLNFSTFGALDAEARAEAVDEMAETIRKGEMPLNSYTWMHASARLDNARINSLLQWLDQNAPAAEKEEHEKD